MSAAAGQKPLILGTRGSALALTQARMTEAALAEAGVATEIRVVKTIGDKRPDLKLSEFSQGDNPVVDKGIFTKELEQALLRGDVDVAVHSLKDVPTELEDDFEIIATLPRAPIEDVVISKQEGWLGDSTGLNRNASGTVATSSVRRARQLSWLCSELEVVATGLRAPNGIGIIDDETWTSGDNQGSWTPACRLNLIKEGDFMQVPPLAHREETPTRYGPPICWIPMGVDNSGGSQVVVPHGEWGLPQGQLLHSSYGKSALFVAAYEVVDGVPQGGLTRLGLSFQSSAMRLRFSPVDGQLYLSGLRGWQTNAPKDGCFHRVRHTGKPVHVPVGCRVTPTGIALTFSHELDREAAEDAQARLALAAPGWSRVAVTRESG